MTRPLALALMAFPLVACPPKGDDSAPTDSDADTDADCDDVPSGDVYLYLDGILVAEVGAPAFSGDISLQLGARHALYDNVSLVADCEPLFTEDFETGLGCFDAGSPSGDGNPGGALDTGPGATYPRCAVAGFDPNARAWSLTFDGKPSSPDLEYEVATGVDGASAGMAQLALDTDASGTGDHAALLTATTGNADFDFPFDGQWHTFVLSNHPLD
jgi:hypothetical protein